MINIPPKRELSRQFSTIHHYVGGEKKKPETNDDDDGKLDRENLLPPRAYSRTNAY